MTEWAVPFLVFRRSKMVLTLLSGAVKVSFHDNLLNKKIFSILGEDKKGILSREKVNI